jgi:hypothetical protein
MRHLSNYIAGSAHSVVVRMGVVLEVRERRTANGCSATRADVQVVPLNALARIWDSFGRGACAWSSRKGHGQGSWRPKRVWRIQTLCTLAGVRLQMPIASVCSGTAVAAGAGRASATSLAIESCRAAARRDRGAARALQRARVQQSGCSTLRSLQGRVRQLRI